MKKALLWTVSCLVLAGVFTYALNETAWLYWEPAARPLQSPGRLFSQAAAPIMSCQPKRDTLILFIHGFKSSPHDFQRAAQVLSAKYNVCVLLLPGHGTTPENFKRTFFTHWYAYARDAFLTYRKEYDHVYVCGHSMGGAIALKLGEEFRQTSAAPDGIIAISAPVFFNAWLEAGVVNDWRLYFSRYISWASSELSEHPSDADQDGADWLGYAGRIYPLQTHSLKLALTGIRARLPALSCPLLLLHAAGDQTVPDANLLYIARRVASKTVRTRRFELPQAQHSRHLLTLYVSSRDEVIAEIERFVDALAATDRTGSALPGKF